MLWILLILLFFNYVVSNDRESNKYIDLLPDKEKEEFLEKIARRILAEIKIGGTPKEPNIEISDEKLNAQSAFVQDIIKKEARSLESKKNGNNLTVLEISSDSERKKDVYAIENKRKKRRDIGVRPLRRKTEKEISNTSENDSSAAVEKVPVSKLNEHNLESDDLINNSKPNYETNIKPFNLFSDKTQVNISSKKIGKQDKSSLEQSKVSPNNKFKIAEMHKISHNSLQNNTQYDNILRKHVKKSHALKKGALNSNSNSFKYILNKTENDVPNTTPLLDESNVQTTGFKASSDKIVNNERTNTSSGILFIDLKPDDNTATSKENSNDTDVSNSDVEILDDKNLNNTTTESTFAADTNFTDSILTDVSTIESATQSDVELLTKEPDVKKLSAPEESSNKKQVNRPEGQENTVTDKEYSYKRNLSFKTVKNINITLSLDRPRKYLKSEKHKEIKTQYKVFNQIPKSYEVYEIGAGEQPFVPQYYSRPRKQSSTSRPQYVPVYNYDPKNAYYDPQDRLAQNYDRDDYIEFADPDNDVIQLRGRVKMNNKSRYNKINHTPLQIYGNVLKKVLSPEKRIYSLNVNFNPNDYMDIDYYLGRSNDYDNDKFPDSNEAMHPYNLIHESENIKDHIRGVRNLLYERQRFGYVPQYNDSIVNDSCASSDELASAINMANIGRSNNNKNPISMDYYYGRDIKDVRSTNTPVTNKNKDSESIASSAKPFYNRADFYREYLYSTHELTIEKPNEYVQNYDSYKHEDMLKVLRDMIKVENEALVNYAWLKSAAIIQAALEKLTQLIQDFKSGERIHPKDIEIFKYTLYLYDSSREEFDKATVNEQSRTYDANVFEPPYKYPHGYNIYDDIFSKLFGFEMFLQETRSQLDEFHSAIKYIAEKTTYRTQNWFQDLKELYFKNTSRHKMDQVLLHLTLNKVFDLIDRNASSIERGYRKYIKTHKNSVRRLQNELIYILRVLEDLRRK